MGSGGEVGITVGPHLGSCTCVTLSSKGQAKPGTQAWSQGCCGRMAFDPAHSYHQTGSLGAEERQGLSSLCTVDTPDWCDPPVEPTGCACQACASPLKSSLLFPGTSASRFAPSLVDKPFSGRIICGASQDFGPCIIHGKHLILQLNLELCMEAVNPGHCNDINNHYVNTAPTQGSQLCLTGQRRKEEIMRCHTGKSCCPRDNLRVCDMPSICRGRFWLALFVYSDYRGCVNPS